MSVSRRTVTVVFADVVDSTPLGARHDPERVRLVLTRYFDLSREVLERYGGTVEKFVGDAVMAVFGIPELHEDDAVRAIRAAAELRDALETLNGELEPTFGVRLGVRIGINTGEVVAGDPAEGGAVFIPRSETDTDAFKRAASDCQLPPPPTDAQIRQLGCTDAQARDDRSDQAPRER